MRLPKSMSLAGSALEVRDAGMQRSHHARLFPGDQKNAAEYRSAASLLKKHWFPECPA
jgi:hypothetical protein